MVVQSMQPPYEYKWTQRGEIPMFELLEDDKVVRAPQTGVGQSYGSVTTSMAHPSFPCPHRTQTETETQNKPYVADWYIQELHQNLR